MTVLLTVAVKPGNGSKPYIVMGSDSLQIKGYPVYSEHGDLIEIEEHYRDDNYEKTFKVKEKLIGLTGHYNDGLNSLVLEYLKENNTNVNRLTQLLSDFVKCFVEDDKELEQQRITITIGAIENGNPILGYLEVDTRSLSKPIVDTIEVNRVGSFVPIFAGNRRKTKDLQESFNKQVVDNCINFNMTSVRKAAKEYLIKSAERYPLTCNTNITFKRLR